MDDTNQKATKELADMMHYVAEDVVGKAPYDVTRNARVTKVYNSGTSITDIIGYDIKVDDKEYHVNKERGKGIIANENDVIKAHFPCNSSNNIYLSYAHDPEDYIKYFLATESDSFGRIYNSKLREQNMSKEYKATYSNAITFPATTKQFSSVDVVLGDSYYYLPLVSIPWRIFISTDNGVHGVVMNSEVYQMDSSHPITIRLYNENPTTTNPVTKNVQLDLFARSICNN